jgi:hypothetical protein
MTKLDARGWKSICVVLDVSSPWKAKKILKRLGLLCYDEDGRPFLNVKLYQDAVERRHKANHKIT